MNRACNHRARYGKHIYRGIWKVSDSWKRHQWVQKDGYTSFDPSVLDDDAFSAASVTDTDVTPAAAQIANDSETTPVALQPDLPSSVTSAVEQMSPNAGGMTSIIVNKDINLPALVSLSH